LQQLVFTLPESLIFPLTLNQRFPGSSPLGLTD
jgi:hypothetical protein